LQSRKNTSKENDKKIRKVYKLQQLLNKSIKVKENGILDCRRAIQLTINLREKIKG